MQIRFSFLSKKSYYSDISSLFYMCYMEGLCRSGMFAADKQ